MKSKNSYSGIDPKVVGLVKFYAKSLKYSADQSIEDIEQDLFCEFFSCLNQYDETKGSLSTFAKQVIKNRIHNLTRKHIHTTPNLKNCMQQESYCFEDESILRVDVERIISKLPEKWQVLCKQLKYHSITEVAHMHNMSRTTLHRILKKMRSKFLSLDEKKCKRK
ncbi:sigma-70 family RNA polymerase sigma factor [Wolbachia endosymbiont of Pentalonia nigronervosa]|jgi:RNA polymerase sigma-70 factor (ECF subfamily)|uniref:sigma-70 family RNA polymerase sigma factor n=1 Tax=Wolbachia endosymbiont of Pentalonia nigronervosa TaxID=1301914 RepID=UPI00165F69C2|nr:sigma-70 family RNA polymerase sigma factor [Wolbachia endosymbiont of Pentalonia nigronervosa]MBD0392279.1 sigma-70 family RNA polymerase sigma factor [Wolbachia endosymbiont of Pentalonia nigronervosa]